MKGPSTRSHRLFRPTTTTSWGMQPERSPSPHLLSDGRPAWVGMDVGAYNHVAPGLAAVEATTFRCVKQPTLRCDRWFERIDTRAKRKGKKRAWRGGNLREADVARSFGSRSPGRVRNPPAPQPYGLSVNWKRLAWCSHSSRTPSPPVVIACTENPCKRPPLSPEDPRRSGSTVSENHRPGSTSQRTVCGRCKFNIVLQEFGNQMPYYALFCR